MFKAQGGYTLPWGTSLAIDHLIQSGELESTTIQQRSRYTFINGRGDLGRVDTLSRVDMKLQHTLTLFGRHQINVAMDVRNLFDQKAVLDIGHAPYRDGFTIPDGTYFAPTGFDIDTYVRNFRAAANDPQGVNNLRRPVLRATAVACGGGFPVPEPAHDSIQRAVPFLTRVGNGGILFTEQEGRPGNLPALLLCAATVV